MLIDYLLNAAVSLTAGVAAIASAFPVLLPYRVQIALFLLLIITLLNLRGLQETGTAMAVPVYFFIATYLAMIVFGSDPPGSSMALVRLRLLTSRPSSR